MADLLKIGPAVGREDDYRTMLGRLLGDTQFNNNHWTGPVASAGSKIAGAWLQKSAMDDAKDQRSQVMASLLKSQEAKPWTDPDSGAADPEGFGAGGIPAMLEAIKGMPDNPYAQDLLPGLLSSDIAQKQAARQAAAERAREDALRRQTRSEQLEDGETEYERKLRLAGISHNNAVDLKRVTPGRAPVPGTDTPFPDEVARQRAEIAGARATAGQVTWTVDPSDPTKQISSTGEVKSLPLSDVEKDSAKKAATAKTVVSLLDFIDRDGQTDKDGNPLPSMFDEATGSVTGAGLDWLAAAFGFTPDSAEAAQSLKMIEGQLVMAMPRMEGPQSNMDQQLYREMVGQIGDPTIPARRKKAAAKTLREIYTRYLPQNSQPAIATSGSATPSPNIQPWTPESSGGWSISPVN